MIINFFGHKTNFMTVGIKIVLMCNRYTKEQARELHHAPRHRYQKLSCIDSAIRDIDNRLTVIMSHGLDKWKTMDPFLCYGTLSYSD